MKWRATCYIRERAKMYIEHRHPSDRIERDEDENKIKRIEWKNSKLSSFYVARSLDVVSVDLNQCIDKLCALWYGNSIANPHGFGCHFRFIADSEIKRNDYYYKYFHCSLFIRPSPPWCSCIQITKLVYMNINDDKRFSFFGNEPKSTHIIIRLQKIEEICGSEDWCITECFTIENKTRSSK